MIKRITLILLSFFCITNAQIALPTFQGVHKPHTTVAESGSQTFSYTGAQQTFTVPSGVSTITIKVWGAQGGSGGYWSNYSYCSTGGKGGYATGNLSVTAGNSVNVYVGGQGQSYSSCQSRMTGSSYAGGWNGGGTGQSNLSGCGGGGASDVRYGGTSISDRKVIAGGGGGGGNAYNSTQLSNGGAGGGASGQTMANNTQLYNRTPGAGGTQSSGNANGIGSNGNQNFAGGGGGGYYGGGVGQNSTGGGGGSGYIGGVTNGPETIAGNESMPDPDGGTMTGRAGNGLVVISW